MRLLSIIPLALVAVINASTLNAYGEKSVEYRYSSGSGQEIRRLSFTEPATIGGVPIGINLLDETAEFEGEVHNLTEGHHFFQSNWFLTSQNGTPQWIFNSTLRNLKDQSKAASLQERTLKKRSSANMYITGPCYYDSDCQQGTVSFISGICGGAPLDQLAYDIYPEGGDTISSVVVDMFDDDVLEYALSQLDDDIIGLIWTTLEWIWY